jgi:hypothetical protein
MKPVAPVTNAVRMRSARDGSWRISCRLEAEPISNNSD